MKQQNQQTLRSEILPPVFLIISMMLGAIFLCPLSMAQENVLQAVDVDSAAGNKLQIRFRLAQPVTTAPRSFTINEPARIVLDFIDTRNGLNARQQAIGRGVAERLNVLEGGDRTRASVNLSHLVPYTVRTQGNTVLLTLDSAPPPVAKTTAVAAGGAPLLQGSLNNVDFRRGPQGQAIVGVKMSNPSIPVSVREEGTQIIAEFQGATLSRGQERRLDVTDFATPVTLVEALNQGNNARVVLQPSGRYEYLAYQTDDVYTIEVKPVQEEEKVQEDPRKKKFTGDLLSLNFQDIEVRAVLQILADFTGLNVVVSDSVKGNLTLRLQNVPWDQALDIILRTKGLTMRQNGNVLYVAPTEEVAAREKLELESQKTVEDLVPLRTEVIRINYAKAKDLKDIIDKQGGGGGGGAAAGGSKDKQDSLLSIRGTAQVDERTNSILIKDIPEKIAQVRTLIARLDIPVRQVMIDSRIVIASDAFSKELGVQWGFAGVRRRDGGIVTTSGTLTGTDTIVNSAVNNLQNTGQPFPVTVPPLDQRLGVKLGADNPFGRLALALLGKDYLVDLELSAMQSEGKGEILSNPRVVTNDRVEASIKQGFEVPFVTPGTANSPPTVQFKEALLSLTVTPQITPDDTIIMDLKVNKDEPDFGRAIVVPGVGANPPLNKREIKTQVLVNNGDTIVLGGVFEQTTNRGVDRVPLLGDIPLLGHLFQKKTNSDNKAELLIFVTPQILTEGGIAAAR